MPEQIDPAKVREQHKRVRVDGTSHCRSYCPGRWPCLPYLLAKQAEVLAAENATLRAIVGVSHGTAPAFPGCTDGNPDLCACGSWTDEECEVCGEGVEGAEVAVIARLTYPFLPDDHPEQAWEFHTAHRSCNPLPLPTGATLDQALAEIATLREQVEQVRMIRDDLRNDPEQEWYGDPVGCIRGALDTALDAFGPHLEESSGVSSE